MLKCRKCGSTELSSPERGLVMCRRCGAAVETPREDPNVGDPELGGFHPGRPSPIPKRPHYRRNSREVDDASFKGAEVILGAPKRRSPRKKASEKHTSATTSASSTEFRARYALAMKEKNWAECLTIAQELLLQGVSDDHERAEVMYAAAFAYEMSGQSARARSAYRNVLSVDSQHTKARRRLALLDVT